MFPFHPICIKTISVAHLSFRYEAEVLTVACILNIRVMEGQTAHLLQEPPCFNKSLKVPGCSRGLRILTSDRSISSLLSQEFMSDNSTLNAGHFRILPRQVHFSHVQLTSRMRQNIHTHIHLIEVGTVQSASHVASDMALSLEKDEAIEVLKHALTHVVVHDPSEGALLPQCEEMAKYLYERLRSAAAAKVKPPKNSRSGKSGKSNWVKWRERSKEPDEKVEAEPVKDVKKRTKEPDEKVKAEPQEKDVKKRRKEPEEKVKAEPQVKDVKKRRKEPEEKVKAEPQVKDVKKRRKEPDEKVKAKPAAKHVKTRKK